MAPDTDRAIRLEKLLGDVQRRWGLKALQPLRASIAATEILSIPTGFRALDHALGIGGIPRGRITEMLGVPTAGVMTLAIKVIASAQALGSPAVLVDLDGTFDPEYAAHSGVDLDTLLLVRPQTGIEALEIAERLAASGGVGVLVFDAGQRSLAEPRGSQALSAALPRLAGLLSDSPCALIVLTRLAPGTTSPEKAPGCSALAHYAGMRLLLEREQWIHRRRDVRGYRVRVSVIKNKLAPAGGSVSITVVFN